MVRAGSKGVGGVEGTREAQETEGRVSVNCRILQGDVFDILPTIPPGSVDCAVTSPPYWMLRSYLPKDHPLKDRELGREKTPAEYVANMVRMARLVRDCLADHGTFWLNVGDTYSASGKSGGGAQGKKWNTMGVQPVGPRGGHWWRCPDIAEGNLCLIPQRLMIALQDDGWLVRSVVVWHKPACMPTSVTGWRWVRCRRKVKSQPKGTQGSVLNGGPRSRDMSNGKYIGGAQWEPCPGCKKCQPHGGWVLRRGSWRPTSTYEPVLMLAKSRRYFADGDAVRTPPAASTVERDRYTRVVDDPDEQFAVAHDHETECDDGANLRDVWTIPFEPLKEKHYAAYPTELVYRCLASGTSQEGYCKACGSPWVRQVEHKNAVIEKTDWGRGAVPRTAPSGTQIEPAETKTVGWRPSCACPDPSPRPGLVLDPFSGSGRTAIVARRLGLDFVGCELSPEYADMSRRLVKADAPLFNHVGDVSHDADPAHVQVDV